MSAFGDIASLRVLSIWEGVVARAVDGEDASFAVVELDPDSVVAEHAHPNEQLGMVLRGNVRFRVDGETQELGPGQTWSIPPNTPHEVHTGPEGAVVIDVFAPPRADWRALETLDPQRPAWP